MFLDKMVKIKIAFLVLFCIFLGSVAPLQIEDPGQDGVKFDNQSTVVHLIYVNEKNEGGRVKMALITGVKANLTINVNTDYKQQIDVQKEDGSDSTQCYLTVALLDYEKLISQSIPTTYPMDIIEGDDLSTIQRLSVEIVNLDDEDPTLWTSACSMEENTIIDVNSSSCAFTVSDSDGWLAAMDFSNISGINNEEELFEFVYKDTPEDDAQTSEVFLILKEGKTLDYETLPFYTFQVQAKDASGHFTSPVGSVSVIVQVIDVPDQLPRWDSGFSSAITLAEKTLTTINVSATDGDIGINNVINYKITKKSHDFVSIDSQTGVITVEPINRDTGDGQNDQVVFIVQAYEVPDPDSFIEGSITLIIEDADDNVAKITVDGYDDQVDLNIDENSSDLNLTIIASDIDLGENAIYTTSLTFAGDIDYSSCFTVVPGRGYESTNLVLTILDPSKLDYEDPDWRVITMELLTTGTKTPSNSDTRTITITLNDINDEMPIFDKTEYTAELRENVKAGTTVLKIQATDADQEDIDGGLKYELFGAFANSILTIEEDGTITTTIDNAFDYEKQQEVILEVSANDKAAHQSVAQLTITVLDVNDENPRMFVSSSITVPENQADGFVLDTQISASDIDLNSDLEFSIDWANSYATKNSQRLSQDIFETIQCIDVKTVADPDTKTFTAELSVKETQQSSTPDYELFDNLYIQLVVTDKNTEEGDGVDSAVIIISIEDTNDNAPVFAEGTETETRIVSENAAVGTVIAIVVATDYDVQDVLTYSIESADENTPSEWVSIDSATGVIRVSSDNIDCDDPKRDNLRYTVTVTDGMYTTTTTITIDIIDMNDNFPVMSDINVSIDESPNGDTSVNGFVVVSLEPTDLDRDEPFYTVICTFATTVDSEVTSRFTIQNNQIIVSLADGVNLDREMQELFIFELNCYDDPERQGPISNPINPPPRVTITLNDINDNAPTITNVDITGFNENTEKDTPITLQGEDLDVANTPNSEISFLKIVKIQRFINKDDDTPQEDPPQDLFVMKAAENNQGILTVNSDKLRGYYGYLVLTISLTDKGESPLTNQVDVTIEVAKYNFEEPAFLFPFDGETSYLETTQIPNSALVIFGGDQMGNIAASDQQGEKFDLNFDIVEDSSGDIKLFTVKNFGNSQGQLQMTSDSFEAKTYTLTIQASIKNYDNSIQGEAPFSKNVTFYIDFFGKEFLFSSLQESVKLLENDRR